MKIILVDKNTRKEVKVGDLITDFRGESSDHLAWWNGRNKITVRSSGHEYNISAYGLNLEYVEET